MMNRDVHSRLNVRAFSLVEVTLALGIVGFALVGILGALPLAMNSERTSVEQTRAASIASVFFTSLRSQPFTKAMYLDSQLYPTSGTPASQAPLDLSSTTTGPFVCYAALDESANGAANDSRLIHFYEAPQGDNCFQVVIRCNNQPSSLITPTAGSPTSANQVDLAVGAVGGPIDTKTSPGQLKFPFRFSSIIADRGSSSL